MNIDPALLDIVPELARFAPPARIMDKARYSAFTAPGFHRSSPHRGRTP